jgi:hypothetical protein
MRVFVRQFNPNEIKTFELFCMYERDASIWLKNNNGVTFVTEVGNDAVYNMLSTYAVRLNPNIVINKEIV